MKIEKYLNELKHEYQSVRPGHRLSVYGWKEISDKIGSKNTGGSGFPIKAWAFALLSLTLLITGGFYFYTIVKAALPGEPLYPVKTFSEDLISKTTGSSQVKVENRAEEIVDLVEKQAEDTENLRETSQSYVEAVKTVKQEVDDSEEETNRLQESLTEDHNQFDEAIKEFPEAEDDIRDAIEISDEDDGEESKED
jgi:hypothetical protein